MSHYNRIAESLSWLADNYRHQPSLADLAARAHLSETHFQKVFTEWAGVSPKKFLQCVTLESARASLDNAGSVLDASLNAGLSGASRLHDLFVSVEALSPGEYKSGGAGLDIAYGFHPTPFGDALLMLSPRGVTSMSFVCDEAPQQLLANLKQRLPKADYHQDATRTGEIINTIFRSLDLTVKNSGADSRKARPVPVLLAGTDFQLQVWRALLEIPEGSCTTYSRIASNVGRENAQRAVGTAIGRNPVAFVIPCHRVIRQNALPGGYRWGLGRKLAILGIERLVTEQNVKAQLKC